jgi:hypothetical protein
MDYLKDIGLILSENKWTILFIVFGILIAYSVGKSIAENNEDKPEYFENRCIKQKRLYEDNKPVKCEEKDEVVKKVTVASASCPKMPNMKDYMRKEDCPDLSDYVHKSLLPDLNNYISKNYVKENYISRELLKKNYMRKCDCRPIPPKDVPIQELEEPPCDPIPIKKIACQTIPVKVDSCEPKPIEQNTCDKNVENKKIQDYLDKNRDNMDVTYSTLDDAFCNKKSCFVNGYPDGLHPLK